MHNAPSDTHHGGRITPLLRHGKGISETAIDCPPPPVHRPTPITPRSKPAAARGHKVHDGVHRTTALTVYPRLHRPRDVSVHHILGPSIEQPERTQKCQACHEVHRAMANECTACTTFCWPLSPAQHQQQDQCSCSTAVGHSYLYVGTK